MKKRYTVSFRPLRNAEKGFLSWTTGIDFMATDFSNETYWFCCSVRDGAVPVIVIVFEFKSPFDAQGTVAVADPRGLSRQLLTILFRAVFQRAARVTVLIDPGNDRAISQIWRMGFKPEGYLRRGYDGRRDAALWGLLPEDCPYLRGVPFRYRVIRETHGLVERMQ
jgi:hypothetical protein